MIDAHMKRVSRLSPRVSAALVVSPHCGERRAAPMSSTGPSPRLCDGRWVVGGGGGGGGGRRSAVVVAVVAVVVVAEAAAAVVVVAVVVVSTLTNLGFGAGAPGLQVRAEGRRVDILTGGGKRRRGGGCEGWQREHAAREQLWLCRRRRRYGDEQTHAAPHCCRRALGVGLTLSDTTYL